MSALTDSRIAETVEQVERALLKTAISYLSDLNIDRLDLSQPKALVYELEGLVEPVTIKTNKLACAAMALNGTSERGWSWGWLDVLHYSNNQTSLVQDNQLVSIGDDLNYLNSTFGCARPECSQSSKHALQKEVSRFFEDAVWSHLCGQFPERNLRGLESNGFSGPLRANITRLSEAAVKYVMDSVFLYSPAKT